VRRRGGTRRLAAVVAPLVALPSLALLAGCGNPTQSVQHCIGAPDSAVLAIQQKFTAKGKLRNGKMVHLEGAPETFISAEIHLDSDAKHDKGDIATWATRDLNSTTDFQSVDVHARENSTWPHAAFDVTTAGAIESRACTGLNRGKTAAELRCEQEQESGNNVALPKGKDCSDL